MGECNTLPICKNIAADPLCSFQCNRKGLLLILQYSTGGLKTYRTFSPVCGDHRKTDPPSNVDNINVLRIRYILLGYQNQAGIKPAKGTYFFTTFRSIWSK